jgi:CTP synthase
MMEAQKRAIGLGGTMRLGAMEMRLKPGSLAAQVYGGEATWERHRHRYEVNNTYREVLQKAGMVLSGTTPDGTLVEMIELPEHPFFIATQAHPEFKSRPNRAHPLFREWIKAAVQHSGRKASRASAPAASRGA